MSPKLYFYLYDGIFIAYFWAKQDSMSINIDSCYGNIIGISRTDCDCYPSSGGYDLTTSDSGIYLDELEAFPFDVVAAAENCHDGNLWDIMIMARNEAVESLKTDLLSCIRSESSIKRPPFNGIIGDIKKANKWLTMGNAYHGLRINCADIKAGYGKLKRIGLYFDTAATFDIEVYNNIDESPIEVIEVTSLAGSLTWIDLPTPLELDMDNQYGSGGLEYFFLFSPSGMKARNTMINCGCGGGFKPDWNESLPYYLAMGDKGNYQWANYVMAIGTRGNDIDDRSNWTKTNETQGLLLDIQFGCDAAKTICNGELDYTNNPLALTMAHAVRMKAGAIAINKVLATGAINQYTLMDGQLLSGIANKYTQDYNDRVISYLCQEIIKHENINTYSDCFTCQDLHGMVKRGILV